MAEFSRFIFCNLPPELRNLVYGHLLFKGLDADDAEDLDRALQKSDEGDDGD